tara:strand:+ start:6511 stop:6732 length:222 start_codon:yes stop_codon:yes gene_type:complete
VKKEFESDVTLHLMRISSDVEHIKEDMSEVRSHLATMNGRVRQNEKDISWIKGIGSTFIFVISSIIAWLGIDK